MKILHTADWHLGKKLDRFSRLEEQTEVLEEIIQIADSQNIDIVVIAGDLFDTFNPPTEAVDLFYKTLKRLSKNGKRPVVAISGNHDSPNFIDAPNPLARECGIILIGQPNAIVPLSELQDFSVTKSEEGFIEIQLKKEDFPIRIFHTAYANEVRLKTYFGENKEDELNTILKEKWKNISEKHADSNGVNLLMTHLYMNKKGAEILEEPDGEKPLKIGNADMVFSDAIPQNIQYTALGHLHGFRNIGSAEKPVVYASSPLCYSFSEAGQTKFVSIIDAQPNQTVTYEKKALQSGKKLERKSFKTVDEAILWLNENPKTWVELTMETDTFLKAEERKLLYQSHSGIVYLIPKVKNVAQLETSVKEINLSQKTEELFADYFKSKNNGLAPNDDLMNLFKEIENLS